MHKALIFSLVAMVGCGNSGFAGDEEAKAIEPIPFGDAGLGFQAKGGAFVLDADQMGGASQVVMGHVGGGLGYSVQDEDGNTLAQVAPELGGFVWQASKLPRIIVRPMGNGSTVGFAPAATYSKPLSGGDVREVSDPVSGIGSFLTDLFGAYACDEAVRRAARWGYTCPRWASLTPFPYCIPALAASCARSAGG